jgi:anti-anti-sigma regulatory factor
VKITFDELCIQEVDSFYNTLIEELAVLQGNPLILDFTNVEKIDMSAIQVLISLRKHCEKSNIDLMYLNMNSSQVQLAIDTFNLNQDLGLTS